MNIAIQGTVKKAKELFETPHVVTSSIEHPAILETLRALEIEGVEVTYLTPNEKGVIDNKEFKDSLRKETCLAVFSYVNSEIGNILPVEELVRSLRHFRRHETGEKYPYFLLDVTQAATCFDLNVQKLGVDLLVLDGSKVGGLKGSGLLFVKEGVEIHPLLYGGGQEEGLRPGTENILAIESLRIALSIAQEKVEEESERLGEISRFFCRRINKRDQPSEHKRKYRQYDSAHCKCVLQRS
ncbi:MAG: aminotransferase class V-fold PLP-dependent enzyme [Candidatus Campbellbacteria bacterium]|nr:aminotransferase class V-fold PLP-dependent enzyme [Candidatus Campbellbacteria bacterium]